MKNLNRDILVLLKSEFMSEKAIEQQVECLHELLVRAEAPENFCQAHELVDRNRITRKPERILKVIATPELPVFRFLLNLN